MTTENPRRHDPTDHACVGGVPGDRFPLDRAEAAPSSQMVVDGVTEARADGRVVTRAELVITAGELTDEKIVARGEAICNPEDHFVPKIGERIAMARALRDLGDQLEKRWSERSVTKAEVQARRGKTEA